MSSRGLKSDGSKGAKSKPIESGVVSDSDSQNSDGVVMVGEIEQTRDVQPCRNCGGPDTDDMVQCDQCDRWHHYDCVGVTDEVVNQSWSCTNCKAAKWIQRTTPTSNKQSTPKDGKKEPKSKRALSVQGASTTTPARSSCGKSKSTHSEPVPPSIPVEQLLVPEPNASQKQSTRTMMENLEPTLQSSIRNSRPKEMLFVPSTEGVPTIELEKAFSEVSCTSSQRSARNRAKLQLMRLQEEREFEERQAERRRREQQEEAERRRAAELDEAEKHKIFLAKKYQILENLASEKGSSRSSSSITSRSRVQEWIASNTQLSTVQSSSAPVAPAQTQQEKRREQKPQKQFPRTQQQEQLQLRQHHQKQVQREQEFRTYQVQQRQEHLQQEKLLREQQQQLQQEEKRICQLWEQHHELERRLREQPFVDRQSKNSVHSRQIPVAERNFDQQNCGSGNAYRESMRRQSGHFSPETLPQSTQVQQQVNHLVRSARNPSRSIHDTPIATRDHRSTKNSSVLEDDDQFQLSRSQIAARQAVSRDLPTFSGNPEEWPIFLSMFNSTTAMCGFTEEENLVRLQRSLKGKAYEAVKCRLMHPGNVKGIMDTLRMLYGQPEIIIHSLIGKISSLPAIREDRLETLVDFAVSVQNFCATVESCGLDEYMYNVTLLHQLVGKLPSSIKLNWAQYRKALLTINLASFSEWIYSLAEAASSVTFPIDSLQPTRNDTRQSKKRETFLNAHSETQEKYDEDSEPSSKSANTSTAIKETCPVCKGICKSVDKCKRFHEFSRDSRWAVVREFGLCRTCLRQHNGSCKAKPCGKDGCSFRHHELLHNDQKFNQQSARATPETSQSLQPTTSGAELGCNTHQTNSSSVLFRYLPVKLFGPEKVIHTYAFLDEGSGTTLLDQDLADELQLNGRPSPICLRWTGGTERYEKNSCIVRLQVAGQYDRAEKFTLEGVQTVHEQQLPRQTLDMNELKQSYRYLGGLPIESYVDARPRILIGTKHAQLGLTLKSREGEFGQPIATKTRLGWTVCGNLGSSEAPSMLHYSFHVCSLNERSTDELHQAMKDYFSIDSLGINSSAKLLLSTEDDRAETLLKSLTCFSGDRYETGLLWRYDNVRLPDSRPMALRRHRCLEKRMARDPLLSKVLHQKIADYSAKGYIYKLSEGEVTDQSTNVWYLPIFPVTNPNKPGKVRIVWDAGTEVYGTSLNSVLLKGPDLLCSLLGILLRFRLHPVAVTGDIREMFHQVKIRKEDQQYQCFYWTDDKGELVVYVMTVMTFGACCSPSSAQYVKNANAERFSGEFPAAFEVITKSHYVDDMLISIATEEEAIRIAKEVRHVHAQGGFEIRNWISNSRRVTKALHEQNVDEEKSLDLSSELPTEKVLGMWWNTTADTFTYKIGWKRYGGPLLKGTKRPTKREVLRVLMTIFDPLGLIAHFLSYLKVLLQEVWRSGVTWDEEIDENAFEKWKTWLSILPQVEQLQIPRSFWPEHHITEADDIQLHTFVDAGKNGMAAACFLRFLNSGQIYCSLVTAKARVAPLKLTSIPRLELQAAVIGTRLSKAALDALSIQNTKRFYWTDSQDVLCWINSDHRRYSQFVGFRVTEILESTEHHEWRYVPSKQNVADDATKWDGLPDLSPASRWFRGPSFLWEDAAKWPTSFKRKESTDTEMLENLLVHHYSPDPVICIQKYSSWKRLQHVTALVHRFIANCRHKAQQNIINYGPLTNEEILSAEACLIRIAQQDGYLEELRILSDKPTAPLPKSSSLYKLTPWIDDRGIMRMKTRIAACQYATEDAKNPVILPRKHHITTLIIHHYHERYHHQNHETVINELRQKYQISRLRTCYYKVLRNCQRCKNDRAVPNTPMMADLPPGRLAAFSRPFTHVGIDYFGPIAVAVGRRNEKRWGMLATCLTTRAIHIELVYSLSTDSCIMAIRNFVARRGQPFKIYSDRGTNFVGANRELQRLHEAINHDKMMKEFTTADTEWVFNPPLAPHMGGSWERMIKTVKSNLMAVCTTKTLSDEVLRNLLTEIENIVNSRPLTHVPVDDDSGPALTPNHFLIGSSNGSKPLNNIDDTGHTLKQNMCTSQVLANRYWKRWVTDYLPEITRRSKWFHSVKPIATGDIVIITDPRSPRNCWPKGKVISTTVSRDGQVRSATVQTIYGVYERPVTKLAILDVQRVEQ